MKITFISPYPDLTGFGVRAIASFIEQEGFETQIIFLPDPVYEKMSSLQERIRYTYPDTMIEQLTALTKDHDLIGISLFSCYFPQAVHLSRVFKGLKKPVLWGGKHATAAPDVALAHADMVGLGEGEIPVLDLVSRMREGRDYFDTPGFWFASSKGVKRNPVGPLLTDLDELPLPNYNFCPHYVWLREEERIVPLDTQVLRNFFSKDPFAGAGGVYWTMSSRGCPFNCSYCYTYRKLYRGQRYVRRRSSENLIRELELVKKQYEFVTFVNICDDEFLSRDSEDIREFSWKYKERVGLPLSCLGSPLNVTEEKLGLLVDAGLSAIQMGVQTVSENGKKAFRRNIPTTKLKAAIGTINKFSSRLLPIYDFIIDNPYETKEDVLENLRFILTIPRPCHFHMFSLLFLAGTYLYQKGIEDGLIEESEENYVQVYRNYCIRYLNIVFMLVNVNTPRVILRILLCRPMVFIFEREWFTRCFTPVMAAVRRVPIIKKFLSNRLKESSKKPSQEKA